MYNTILSIGREDLESRTMVKLLDLTWSLSLRSLILVMNSDASIHSSLVNKNKLVRTEGRYIMHILVSKVWVTLLGDVLHSFLRLIDIL
jgi:hypothetical protein